MQEYLRYLHSRHQLIFSTDVAGFFGNPGCAVEFFKTVVNGELNFGLEVLAFLHCVNNLHTHPVDGDHNERIAGFHGKPGRLPLLGRSPFDSAKMAFLNSQFPPTLELLGVAGSLNRHVYVNVHDIEAADLEKSGVLVQIKKHAPALLAVENDVNPNSVAQTKDITTRHKLGRIYDIVHAEKARKNFIWADDWPSLAREMRDFQPSLIHIPVGTDESDSLDPKAVPPEFWTETARVIAEQHCFPVIECQWGISRGSIACNPAKDAWRIRHLRENLKVLVSAKIITKL